MNVNSFDHQRSDNLSDGSFKGIKDREAFCDVWYENRTLGRDDDEGTLNIIILYKVMLHIYLLQNL